MEPEALGGQKDPPCLYEIRPSGLLKDRSNIHHIRNSNENTSVRKKAKLYDEKDKETRGLGASREGLERSKELGGVRGGLEAR